MKSLGWRILVVSDLGGTADGTVAVKPGADWMKPLGIQLSVTTAGGVTALEVSEEKNLAPEFLSKLVSGDLNEVLHNSSFQKVEAACTGIRFLMEYTADTVGVEVLSSSRADLVKNFRAKVFDKEMKGVPENPIGLILLDYDFTHKQSDLKVVQELAEMAAALQAPIVASTSPEIFNLKSIIMLPKLSDIPQRLADPNHGAWQKFQKDDRSRWVALTVNRWLLREPYTKEKGGFEEKTDRNKPETFLWGRGIWLIGSAVARSVKEHGHALAIAGPQGGLFQDMALREVIRGANKKHKLTTEVEIADMPAMEMSRAAFTPLIGKLDAGVVILQHVVNVYRTQPGKLTVSGTVAYQIMMGRVANALAFVVGDMPADEAGALAHLKKELTEFLGPLAGKEPDKAVTVVAEKVKQGDQEISVASITVAPEAKLESMEFTFHFQIPLQG